jgi:hypothetical protein
MTRSRTDRPRAGCERSRSAESIKARSYQTVRKAGHMTASDHCSSREKTLASREPSTHKAALFVHLSKVDHIPMHVAGHSRMMASESDPLTPEEFASLLTVGNTCAVREPPAVIPAEHSARLIGLGYIADLAGRLRMTTPGRSRIAAGFRNRPLPLSDLATEEGSHLFKG